MAEIELNGARLHYELRGEGDGMVLVHGSWDDHHAFDAVAPVLAERFRVLAYDRRGHSASEGGGTLDDDVADLAGLIEELALAPAHIVGHSRGGSIALRLAISRPELVRTVNVHEPPLVALVADDPEGQTQLAEVGPRVAQVIAEIEAGEREAATRRFVDEVAVGEGAWARLPPQVRASLSANAGTFAEEERDPTVSTIDLDAVAELRMPLLLTHGDRSPPMFAPVIDRLEAAAPDTERRLFEGASHPVNLTHPAEYAAAIEEFAVRR